MRINVDPLPQTMSISAPASPRVEPPEHAARGRDSSVQTVEKTLALLEVVAERGGATAKEASEALGYPLPTTYRLLQALVQADYLVHLREERRFELGYKLDALGVSLHGCTTTPRPPGTSPCTAAPTSSSRTSSTARSTRDSDR
jgi:hypothetical protein